MEEMKLQNRLHELAIRYNTLEENYSRMVRIWNKERNHERELEELIEFQAKQILELNNRLKKLEEN
jgi:hypothetical protein